MANINIYSIAIWNIRITEYYYYYYKYINIIILLFILFICRVNGIVDLIL